MSKRAVPGPYDCRIITLFRFDPRQIRFSLPAGMALRQAARDIGVGGVVVFRRQAMGSSLLPLRPAAHKTVLHFLSAESWRRGQLQTGAVVMRYDTSSRWNAWVGRGWYGGRRHHHARVDVAHAVDAIQVRCESDDHAMRFVLDARPQRDADRLSAFASKDLVMQILRHDLREVSLLRQMRPGSGRRSMCQTQLVPLGVEQLESSFFDDPQLFGRGAAQFDSAYWLRDEEVVWSEQGSLCCDIATA
jgi:hypothetical protein